MGKKTKPKTWLVMVVFLLRLSGSVWATGTFQDDVDTLIKGGT